MTRLFQKLRKAKKKETVYDTKPPPAPSAFEELPVEVKRHIASFLSVRDLLKFSETSKRINQDLDVVMVSSPLTDRASQDKTFQTHDTTQCFAAVIPNQEESRSHPTTFAFHVDTSTNSPFFMGVIRMVEQDLRSNQSPGKLKSRHLRRGKTVARIELIGEMNRQMNLPFYPKTGKFYQLWVTTEVDPLCLNNMMLHHVGLATKPSRHTAFQFEVQVRRPTMRSCVLR